VTSAPIDLLRPKPFRGDVIAAGVVVLVTLVVTCAMRFDARWTAETHLIYATVAWVFVTSMAVLAPLEGEHPRAYQSILYVASVALLLTALIELARVAGAGELGVRASTVAWIAAVAALNGLAFAIRRNSAVSTLVAALAGGVAVLAAVQSIWTPDDAAPFRWVLAGLMVVYGIFAIGQRDRRLRHGVALIDAAGLAVLAIAQTFLAEGLIFGFLEDGAPHAGWGWELLILVAGFGLIAYSSADRQPGPAYLGVLALGSFALIDSGAVAHEDASFAGWPLVLVVGAAVLLVVGLRPTTPAPPPPDVDAPEPPPLPLR
jgi:hypothetical protein